MKRGIAPFGRGSVSLRLIEEADLETTLSWRNRDDARIWFKTSVPLTLEQHRAWFHSYLNRDEDFLFVVELEGKPVGQASVYNIRWDEGSAELGRFLAAPDARGKGLISQACGELMEFCRASLGLSYLYLEVLETNEQAIRVYKRNNFGEESRYDGLFRMSCSLGTTDKSSWIAHGS